MKVNRRRLVLPLGVLLISFLLAILRPADEPMVSAGNADGVTVGQPNHVPPGGTSPFIWASSIVGGAAFVVVVLVAGSILFLLFRLFIRRRKTDELEQYRERPRASVFDFAMLAVIVLLGGGAVLALRAVLVSDGSAPAVRTATAQHVSTPPEENSSSFAPTQTAMARWSDPSVPLRVTLSVVAGVATLLFMLVRQRAQSMRLEQGLGPPASFDTSQSDPGEGRGNGIRRTYAEMRRILFPVASDDAWLTPREYAAKVRRSGIECEAVQTLTRLFEVDRYRAVRNRTAAGEAKNGSSDPGSSVRELLENLLEQVTRAVGTTTERHGDNLDTPGGPDGDGQLR